VAKVTLHPTIERLQGKLGNIVFRRTHSGTLSAAKAPDMSKVRWSQPQQDHRQRFKQAVTLAKAAIVNTEVRKKYEKAAAKKGKRPFRLRRGGLRLFS
jgi:hypothetical protein